MLMLMLMLGASSAFAQLNYGIKGGANLVNMALDLDPLLPNFDNQYRLSYHIGVYGVYHISERFSIGEEILYSNKGYTSNLPSLVVPATGAIDRVSLQLHYISVPILAGYSLRKNLSVHLGPEISYLLSARYRNDGRSNDAGFLYGKTIDIGAVAGLSCLIGERASVGLRYIHGLNDVTEYNVIFRDPEDPLLNGLDDLKAQNRVFQLSMWYRLN